MSMFPCIKDGTIPSERLNVFISSAMNNENGIVWTDVRKRVRNKLNTCPFINPFIIEEHGREIPSSQLFLYKVQQADILILILSEEIRPGVRQEIEIARSRGKAVIAYFFKIANSDSDASKLKAEFIESDYCTFKIFEDFEKLEDEIFNDLLHNIVDKYKYQHFLDSQKHEDSFKIVEIMRYQEIDNPIKKSTLKYFDSCYGTIASEIGYGHMEPTQKENKENSSFSSFGLKILKWVVHGSNFVTQEEISIFTEQVKTIYSGSEWIVHRWDAILNYISNDVCKALQHEEKALEIAREINAPEWIINDILIDCRNLESESSIGIISHGRYQQELNGRDDLIYVPISDRYVRNSYDKLLEEDIKLGTAMPGTYHFGGNITETLGNIENYIFMSLLYGSFTHLFAARSKLSIIFYKYGKIYNDHDLIFKSVKLIILTGNTKLLNNIILKEWDGLYYLLSSNADDLWDVTDNVNKEKQLGTKLLLIGMLGLYLNEPHFMEVNDYLFDMSRKIKWNECSELLKAVLGNISRIPDLVVTRILINILERKQVQFGSDISRVLLSLDLHSVPDEIQSILEKNIEINLDTILQNNGTPQFIAHLINENPNIFSNLESCMPEDMDSVEMSLFEINVGRSENWSDVLLNSINDARCQLKANSETNVVYGFGTMPYKTIQMIIENCVDDKLIKVLKEDFIQLAIDVFKSTVPMDMKEDCMECLIKVIIIFNEKNIPVEKDLLDTIESLHIENQRHPDILSSSSTITSMYRWIMLKAVSGFDIKKDILANYLSFAQKDDHERYILSQCINQYMYFCMKNEKIIEELFLLIIIEMCSDSYYLVRKEASNCLVYLLSTQYSDIAKQKLIVLTTDSSPNVRGNILSILEKKIESSEIRKEILECYRQDANFGIRKRAEKMII
jgi:hypothetical protein